MLDDPKYIAQFDNHNGLAMVGGQPEQLQQKFTPVLPKAEIRNVVVAGMGGSALGAEFLKSWLADRLEVTLEIVREYELPKCVNRQTLLIAASYSGNTEETLEALETARQRGAVVATIAAGGKLANANPTKSHLEIPGGLQPRLAVLYSLKALAVTLEAAGLARGIVAELEAAGDWLHDQVPAFIQSVPEAENPAKQIAKQLAGHPVSVLAGPTLAYPAMKWKIDINENAKSLAFYNRLPEFNHNEFNGWAIAKNSTFKVVQLQSSLDSQRITKRFEVSNRLLSGHMPAPIIVHASGETKLQQMLWAVLLGDFMSLYLGFLYQIDPIPVDLVEKLKAEITK